MYRVGSVTSTIVSSFNLLSFVSPLEDGQMSGRNMQETIVNKSYFSSVHFVAIIITVLYRVKGQLSKPEVYTHRKLT